MLRSASRLAILLPTASISRTRLSAGRFVASMSGEHTYKWPRPSVTVDAAIIAMPEAAERAPQLLLIQRKNPPCKGQWALPGGFVDENEPLDAAVARELQEETSVDPKDVTLTQVGAFGDPGRDFRGWCVTVAYSALVPSSLLGVKAADDAADARWFDVTSLPKLAFDHKLIVRTVFERALERPEVVSNADVAAKLQAAVEDLQGTWDPPTE